MGKKISAKFIAAFATLAVCAIFIFSPVLVATAVDIENPLGQGATFEKIIERVAQWATVIAVPVATLMILIAGYLYLTGGGNPDQIKKARQALTWALVGFAIVLLANGAATLIKNILRV